jgi:hypothetical protein
MKRAPNIQWFVQKINIPGISTATPQESIPNLQIPFQGEHMMFDTLNIEFKVGEDLADYQEIASWLRGSSTWPTPAYKTLKDQSKISGLGLKSDIVLMVLDSSKNPIFEVTFHDAFPVALSSLEFTSVADTVQYSTATANFRYTDFEIFLEDFTF